MYMQLVVMVLTLLSGSKSTYIHTAFTQSSWWQSEGTCQMYPHRKVVTVVLTTEND